MAPATPAQSIRRQLLALFAFLLGCGATVIVIDEYAQYQARQSLERLQERPLERMRALKAVSEGHGRIKAMVPVLYADVDPRLHPAAARSVLGHMIDLTRRGIVTTDGEPGLDSEYRLA